MASLEKIPSQQEPADDRSEHVGTFSALEAWLKRNKFAAALAGGVAIASCDHAPVAQAAEITPEASWEEGVDILKKAVFEETQEMGTLFVTNGSEQGGVWLSIKLERQDLKNPYVYTVESPHIVLFHAQIRNPHLFNSDSRACILHTHPLHLAKEWFFREKQKEEAETSQTQDCAMLVAPPSRVDFFGYTHMLAALANQREYAPPSLSGAVAVPAGIWYYDMATDEEQREGRDFFKRWPALMPKTEETPNAPAIPATPDAAYDHWQALANEHSLVAASTAGEQLILSLAAQQLGYTIRFVPYERVANEPPCAGVDYHPQAEKK